MQGTLCLTAHLTIALSSAGREALRWVADLCWVGADMDGDAHQRHGADQQEYADDDHGRGVTPLPA